MQRVSTVPTSVQQCRSEVETAFDTHVFNILQHGATMLQQMLN